MTCNECNRTDGRHESWGLKGDVIDEINCKGIYDDKNIPGRKVHCPNNAPIGGGGYCGPCRWSKDSNIKTDKDNNMLIPEHEMALETLISKED